MDKTKQLALNLFGVTLVGSYSWLALQGSVRHDWVVGQSGFGQWTNVGVGHLAWTAKDLSCLSLLKPSGGGFGQLRVRIRRLVLSKVPSLGLGAVGRITE